MNLYDKSAIILHTDRDDLREFWFKRFDRLISLSEEFDRDLAEKTVTPRQLDWISSFATFKDQACWVEAGIRFFNEAKGKAFSYQLE